MDEHAVSPVLGTILMVAITVVLAGGVFLVLNDDAPPEVPRLSFHIDHDGPGATLTVLSVKGDSGETFWERVAVADASTAACTLPTGEMHAGDVVSCSTEGRLVLTYQVGAGDAVLIYDTVLR